MNNKLISELLVEVKLNKKYSEISDEIILPEIKNYISKNKLTKITKQDIKEIRNSLHKSYASFQTKKKNKIAIYLNELKNNPDDLTVTNKLLSITLSTKERLNSYLEIYQQIFEITSNPKTIIDLGAGFNIFSYPLMGLPSLTYYSYDINEKDIAYINDYIKIMKNKGLKGTAQILNLFDFEKVKNLFSSLPSADIVFLFKVIDLIDKDNHKSSEELIIYLLKNKKANFIVASFATKTLTRKSMNYPNRKWFELMLQRNNLNFKTFKTDNELFYVVSYLDF
ncbi:MAG: hypothetical protein WC979_06810 [Candidatus Pacearchaeota archaeon]|jgi:hypothetical protein